MKENIYNKIFNRKCAVCGSIYNADIYGQGECKNCGWYGWHMFRNGLYWSFVESIR